MSVIPLFLFPLLLYSIPALCGGVAIGWLFKLKLELSFFVILLAPVCLWEVGVYAFDDKSLSNFVVEPLILAAAVLVVTVAFGALTRWAKVEERILRRCFAGAALLCAFSVLVFVPYLAE